MNPVDKERLRKEILKRRDALSAHERGAKSAQIADRFLALPEYENAQAIFLYAAFRTEVQTHALMVRMRRDGRRLIASRTDSAARRLALYEIHDPLQDLRPGYMGIPEPRGGASRAVALEEVDLVVTPAVGYDASGNRLGYGGGYYDRLFEQLSADAPRVGFAFEAQIVPHIPAEPHDAKVPIIVTETRVIRA